MSDSPSYKDKLDPRLLALISSVMDLYDFFAIHDNSGEALLPEFLEKFKTEGCPAWSYLYNRKKLKMFNFLRSAATEYSAELQAEIKRVGAIKDSAAQETAACEALAKFAQEIKDCLLKAFRRKSIQHILPYYIFHVCFYVPAYLGNLWPIS